MNCPIPSPRDVRHFLEGFCLETQDQITFNNVSFSDAVTEIDLGASVSALRANMSISGTGIPTGAIIQSVDYDLNKVTLNAPVSGPQAAITVTVTRNTYLTDEWIINRRDRFVIPWIKKRTALNISGEREITEYVSGNGLTTLILSHRPIIEVKSLTYTNAPADSVGDLSESIVVDNEQGILISKWDVFSAASRSVFSRGTKNIKVVYSIGYSSLCDDAPDVPEAIINWLAALSLQLIGSRTGGGNESQSGFSTSYGDRGKYSEAIKMCESNAMAILRNYFEYVSAP